MKKNKKHIAIKPVLVLCCMTSFLLPTEQSLGQDQQSRNEPRMPPESGWSTFLRGGYVHQFDTDMDTTDSSFTADRLFIQPGLSYAPDHTRSFSFVFGYGYDNYDFNGENGFGLSSPWESIYSLRLSTPIRLTKGNHWSFFMIPTIRFTGEKDADFRDSLTGGAFAGFAYRFSERLSIGPGIGVISQIEDDASIFPVLIINWKITNTISLETGRGLGATLGPGISLQWKFAEKWLFTLGGRYEKLRFRLDDQADTPEGVGQDESFPVFAGLTYNFKPSARVSLIGGLETAGELQLEDQYGNILEEEDYETAPFLGLSFSYRF